MNDFVEQFNSMPSEWRGHVMMAMQLMVDRDPDAMALVEQKRAGTINQDEFSERLCDLVGKAYDD